MSFGADIAYINLCILKLKCIRKVKQQCWQAADDHHYMVMGFSLTMSRWSGRVNRETKAQQLSCNSDAMNGKSHKRTDLTLNIWFLLLKMRKCEREPHNNKTNTQHQYSYSITAQIKASVHVPNRKQKNITVGQPPCKLLHSTFKYYKYCTYTSAA